MYTHPDDFRDLSEAKLARSVSKEDFEMIQKVRFEAFQKFFNLFPLLIGSIFAKKNT